MSDWYERRISEDVNLHGPGIYVWEIDGVGTYVGKARRLAKRLPAYPRSVRNIQGGRPYRRNNPDGFREVHKALAAACAEGRRVTLWIAEVCTEDELNAREAYWIGQIGTLNRTLGRPDENRT